MDEVEEQELSKEELKLTKTLLAASRIEDLDYTKFRDRYVDRLGKLIQSKDDAKGAVPQELGQVVHFLNNPDDVPLAIDNACSLTREMHRVATERGTKLVFVYLPPPFVGQPHHFRKERERTTDILGIDEEDLGLSDQVADPWLEYARGLGIPCLDLRPVFQEDEELVHAEGEEAPEVAYTSDDLRYTFDATHFSWWNLRRPKLRSSFMRCRASG